MDQQDREYFAKREKIERAAAQNAASDAAKLVHEQLAQSYHELASGPGERGTRSSLRDGGSRTAKRDEVALGRHEPDFG